MTPLSSADKLLADISGFSADLQSLQSEMETELAAIRTRYSIGITTAQNGIARLEAALETLVKSHKAEILRDSDRANLPHGSVMIKIEKRVRRIRNMLDRLEALRMTGLIKTAKAPDWDAIDKLDDSELKKLGTGRKKKELFSYELKG